MYGRKRDDTIPSLRRRLIGDSLERKRDLEKLIKLIRAEEQEKFEKADRSRTRKAAAHEG